jgi:hypothetical protein
VQKCEGGRGGIEWRGRGTNVVLLAYVVCLTMEEKRETRKLMQT